MEGKIIELRINGVGNAFLRELGCGCVQCTASKQRSSTSASFLIKDKAKVNSKISKHILFDCGPGTVDSLIDYNISTIDYLFNTHNHFDHIGDIDRIINSLSRHQINDKKLPFYATEGTWKKGILANFSWLVSKIDWRNLAINGEIKPIKLDFDINLKIIPIPVYHGPFAYQPVIFVIEFNTNNRNKKIIFCWDILHLVTEFPDFSETTIENPQQEKIEDLSTIYKILKQADDLFLECNTVTPNPGTGHQSIIDGFDLIKRISPKRTWIIHYSGHEDKFGPLSDYELQYWINLNKAKYKLNNKEIKMAEHGMVINYSI